MTDIFGYKEKFLIKAKDNNIKTMFDNISDFESNISATGDLCKFNVKEFEELLAYLGTSKKRSLSTIKADMSRIYKYLSYCQSLPGASLTEEKIKNYYKQGFHSVERWLNSLGVYTDYSKTTISINDMLKIHTSNNMFDGQEEALFWLLFLGVEDDEIVKIEMNQVDNWQGVLKGNIQLNADIKKNISIALDRARNQDSIEKKGRNGVITHPHLKGNKYLFRSDKGNGNSPVCLYFNRRYIKIKEYFDKERLANTDMRKSGMLYFASELLNFNNINSKDDFNSKIFYPICEMYGESPESYLHAFNDLIFSDVLKEYYNITVPETAREKKVTTNTFTDPEKWDKTDRKPWKEDEELGSKGEKLLLEELKHRYNTCYKTKDYSGFDIYAKNTNNDLRCIEVKTMSSKSCAINITKHEYEIAHSLRYGEYYWIYLIVLEDKPLVYSYKNFFGLLGINNMTDKIFQNNVLKGMGSYSYRDFSITLDEDFFDKCEEHLELSKV